jgi:hypothetical protein
MASLLESLRQLATPELVGQVGQRIGMDDQSVKRVMGMVGPLLLQALGNQATTGSGAAGLFDTLSKVDSGSIMGNVFGAMTSGEGDAILDRLFGLGRRAVEGALQKHLGIDVAPLMSMVAPVVLGFLSNLVKQQNLDVAGLAAALSDEVASFAEGHGDEAVVVNEALAAGDKVIEHAGQTRNRFSSDEWQTLRVGPFMVAGLVMIAAPSNDAGRAAEVAALAQSMAAGVKLAAPDALIGVLHYDAREQLAEVLANGAPIDLQAHPERVATAGLEVCQRVASILGAKASMEEANSYKQWLMSMATAVANAAKEGGIFGIGAKPVSADEQAALDQIATALGLSVAHP